MLTCQYAPVNGCLVAGGVHHGPQALQLLGSLVSLPAAILKLLLFLFAVL